MKHKEDARRRGLEYGRFAAGVEYWRHKTTGIVVTYSVDFKRWTYHTTPS